jgi:predicted Zn finger-like uncharacterized protein
VAEAIHCPSCTTRYRLRPERLKPVIRRAKCFTCGGVFPVGDIVQRLLALPAPAATAAFPPQAVSAVQHHDFEPVEASAGFPFPAPAAVQPHAAEPAETTAPFLSPGDLDQADDDMLEQTLVTVPEPYPEAKVDGGLGYPPEITDTTLSGYTSARDAIEKLFGTAPAAATGLKLHQESRSMDMEATMSALDSTLGATATASPSAGRGHLDDSTTASGLREEDLPGPSTSTLRLSQEDVLASLSAAPSRTASPAEPTVALRASDLVAAKEEQISQAATTPVPRSFAPLAETPTTGAELLRLKIGEEIYGGLTMPQLIAWVEEGRILENHLVARQYSENWLEAHKVPGLRPVFDRLRRERSGSAASLESGSVEIAPKKSLFGGLFGKN